VSQPASVWRVSSVGPSGNRLGLVDIYEAGPMENQQGQRRDLLSEAVARPGSLSCSVLGTSWTLSRPWLRWKNASREPGRPSELPDDIGSPRASTQARLVLVDQGPAMMEKWAVELFDESGPYLTLTKAETSALWPKLPVELVLGSRSASVAGR
jgi:hypothetical protein